MTKNRSIKIAVLVLALALITSCFVGTTFAKYISTSEGSAAAIVAKWDIELNDEAIEEDFNFNLFAVVSNVDAETGIVGTGDDANVDNTRVIDGENVSLIAPGTGGSVTIKLADASEVTTQYDVDFTVDAAGVPLKWSKTNNGTDWAEWNDATFDIVDASFDAEGNATITLYYMWAFEQADVAAGDLADTTLGLAAAAKPTVTAKVTVTQVN